MLKVEADGHSVELSWLYLSHRLNLVTETGRELLIETSCHVSSRRFTADEGLKKINLYLTTGNPCERLLCCYSENCLKLAFRFYCVYAVSCCMPVFYEYVLQEIGYFLKLL